MRSAPTPRRRRARIVAAFAASLLLAAACSDDGASTGRVGDGGTSTTGAPDGASPGSEPAADPATGDGPVGRPGAPAGPGAPSPGTVREPPAQQADAFPPDPGPVPVGRLAPFVLRPATGTRVVVEVRAQDGAAPRQATVDHVVRALREASGKEIVVDGPRLVPGGAREWTSSSLAQVADAAAQQAQGGGQAVLRLLFLHGSFEGDSGVLGVAVRGDVAALFSDQIDAAAGVLVDPAVVEDAVTVHELGHLLGLVDLVLGTGRGDPEHPGHSRSRDSVMYWQVESGLIGQLLSGGIPREFDADDRAELAAIRAR